MSYPEHLPASSVSCNITGTCQPEVEGSPEVWRTLMAVYLGAILLLSLGFNIMICLVFYKKSHLLSISNCFVLNLACCQLCMALLVLPFSLVSVVSHNLVYSGPWCQLQGFFSTIVIITLQLNLLVISLDRNYAIMNSLRYNSVFTQRLCTILNCGSWAVGVVMAVPPLLRLGMAEYSYQPYQFICALNWTSNSGYLILFSLVTFGIPILLESCCYIRIFTAAVGHTKRGSRVYPSISVTRSSTKFVRETPSDSSESSDGASSIESKQYTAGYKAVRTIFLIALFYSACWVPYFTSSALNAFYGVTIPHLSAASICMLYSSGILNPIIYVYLNRVIRREIGKFLCGTSSRADADDYLSTSMSTFSSAKQTVSTQRIRSKSTGGPGNEMDTIVEESEDTVFETRSETNLQLMAVSAAPKDISRRESVTCSPNAGMFQAVCTTGNVASVTIPVVKQYDRTCSCSYITETGGKSVNDTDQKNVDSPANKSVQVQCEHSVNCESIKTKPDCAQDGLEVDSKTKSIRQIRPLKKNSRSSSFTYFSKGKKRKKRDCGSFLYFEHDQPLAKIQESIKENEERSERRRRPERYSLDHRISMSSVPKSVKLRLSVTDIHDNANRVTIRSNVSVNEQTTLHKDVRHSPIRESDNSSGGLDNEVTYSDSVQACSIIKVKPDGASVGITGSHCISGHM